MTETDRKALEASFRQFLAEWATEDEDDGDRLPDLPELTSSR